MVALTGALSASPSLLLKGLSSMRLALPMALIGSISSLFGALVGFVLPVRIIETAMGTVIILIVVLMAFSRKSDFPDVRKARGLSRTMGIEGSYLEETLQKEVSWSVHITPWGFLMFVVIGFMGGMFGLGVGWANVPVFNLLLGAPLKISVATSSLTISLNSTAAAWVYLHEAAVLPLITIPSVAGMMLGTRLGARILPKAPTRMIRWFVVGFLLLAGVRTILKGTGIWV